MVQKCFNRKRRMNMVEASYNTAGDEFFMRIALDKATQAASCGEVPVGAVVVRDQKLIGQGRNQRETLQRSTAHAEILAIDKASSYLKSWRLEQCTLYATLEPCIMCVGAILQARVSRLVFGCLDPKAGAVRSLYRLCEDPRLNHQVEVSHGILEGECAQVLSQFFARLRDSKLSASSAEIQQRLRNVRAER
jgi:tRNA(adenine34) deaminase